jgi:hypothetical protein
MPGGWPNAAYWHATSEYRQGTGPVRHREVWIGHREAGVLEDSGAGNHPISLPVASFPVGASGISWDQLYALPIDPTALENVLRADSRGAGPDPDSELFTIVGDLLRESPAPPALRAALYEVAARIPGITLIGPVTDSLGRHGTAIERSGQTYVFDPSSGQILDESEAGGWSTAYLSSGPASTAPAL